MNLKLAIQKSGRLHDDSIQLLNDCGMGIKGGSNQLKAVSEHLPLEVYFLRDDDIPQYVQDGVAHAGIVGENVLLEKEKGIAVVEPLGFGADQFRRHWVGGVSGLRFVVVGTSVPHP